MGTTDLQSVVPLFLTHCAGPLGEELFRNATIGRQRSAAASIRELETHLRHETEHDESKYRCRRCTIRPRSLDRFSHIDAAHCDETHYGPAPVALKPLAATANSPSDFFVARYWITDMRLPFSITRLVVAVAAFAAFGAITLRLVAQDAGLKAAFERYDKNNDGKVTAEELGQPALFKALDGNGDGHITLQEARERFPRVRNLQPKPDAAPTTKAVAQATEDSDLKRGPKVLAGAPEGIGRFVPDVEFKDLDGKAHRLSEFKGKQAIVIAVTSTSCPLSKKYLPTLGQLEARYRDRSVAFVYVNATETDKAADIQAVIKDNGLRGIYSHDGDSKLLAQLRAKTTTECFVLDGSRTLIYRGAVDDQYGIGYSIDAPKQSYLAKAIEATLKQQAPEVATTTAPGCELGLDEPAQPTTVTYHAQIARIIRTHCIECHRDGGVAPFALATADDVIAHGPMIKQVIERGVMPPWFAAKPHAGQPSLWVNDRSLPEADKAQLLSWLASKHPLGDPADAPAARDFSSGWLIGKPDAVYQFSKPVAVKATGVMSYQNIVVDTDLTEDKWVQAIEIQPGVREVVHHVLVFVMKDGERRGDDDEEGRGGFWAAYVPGNSYRIFGEGYGKRLPQGAKLRFQMHYTPNGKAVEDITKIGVVFAKQPPQHEIKVTGIVNPRLSIPPGADNHREEATLRLPFDVEVLGFMPHMHLRGKACRYEVGTTETDARMLLDIPRYDFNWQLVYRPTEPISLTQGQTIRFTAWYDNSKNNPANPDPTKTVRWGNQTFDEMHLGYIEYVQPGVAPGSSNNLRAAQVSARLGEALFESVDSDKDGFLTRDELNAVKDKYPKLKENPKLIDLMFERLDTDKNSKLDQTELKKLRELINQ